MAKKKIDIKKSLVSEMELITPILAEQYLETNQNNRKVNKRLVAEYAKQIRDGEWLQNGESIKFSEDGVLLDGQHRLQAIILSETPCEVLVIRGLSKESSKTIDTGKRRNRSDVLYMAGFQNVTALAGALRIVGIFEETRNRNIYPGIFQGRRMTNTRILELANTKKGMQVAVDSLYGEYSYVNRILGPSAGAALFYVLSKKDKELAAEFFSALATGINLGQDSVMRSCREKLIKNLTDARKLAPGDRMVLVIRTWNFLRQGIRDKKLIVLPNSPVPEIL